MSDAEILLSLIEKERRSEAVWRELPVPGGIAGQEATHVRGLSRALGRPAPGAAPAPAEPSLRAALAIEDELVRAYSEAIGTISDVRLLAPLASICANHGQHLVILRRELGRPRLARAFEPVE